MNEYHGYQPLYLHINFLQNKLNNNVAYEHVMCRCGLFKGKKIIIASTHNAVFQKFSLAYIRIRLHKIFIWKDHPSLRSCSQNTQKMHFWRKEGNAMMLSMAATNTCFTSFCKKQKVKGDFKLWAFGWNAVNGIWLKRHKAAFNREVPPHWVCVSTHSISVVVEDSSCQSIHAQWFKKKKSRILSRM